MIFNSWGYDFSQTEEHGQTLYYSITSAVEPYTVKVTYPNSSATYGSAAYSGFSKPTGSITIPTTVTNETTTYTVTAIDKWAFYSCSNVSSVSLPNSITTIGEYAFNGCSKLEGITIPNSVTTIETYAFQGCSHYMFTDITIPNSVTTIGNNAFEGCSKVTAISIGTGLTTLATNVFKGLNSLTSVTLPSNITTIQSNAFQNCSKLTTIEGPGVTTISASAFASCSKLTTINFPALVSISNKAFDSCTSLESVTIPSTVTSISGNPFYGCSSLATITVDPANTKYTSGDGANCIINKNNNQLLTGCLGTTIPEGVVKINDNAFYDYSRLTSINIPNSVTNIGGNAFYGCKLASLTLPEGLTTIASSAFAYNNTLTSVIIPSTVTIIQSNAFQYCTSLTSVIVLRESSIPSLSTNVFYKNYSSIIDGLIIYVPSNQIESYKAASNWKTYASNIDNDGVNVYKTDGTWGNSSNWSSGSVSTSSDYVVINAACQIANNSTGTAEKIVLGPNGSLTIANGGQLICNSSVAATVQKDITASTAKDGEGWYTIASAVNTPSITSATNLTDGTYDLYRFEESEQEKPWENYKAHSSTDFTTLENGRGYLYRNGANKTLSFTGNTNVGDVSCSVSNSGGDFAGFNLIGNPYPHNIYKGAGTAIPNSVTSGYELATGFHTLTNEGAWSTGTDNSTAILPGQGIMVEATTAGTITIEDKTSSSSSKYNNEYIRFTVENAEYSDDAYAWFDKGYGLHKIDHRNPAIPMLYIPQDGEDYSIAIMKDNTEAFGLNFKANTTGSYTLKYNTKGNFDYLHVIDRLTGKDTDMLLDGEYSFVGSTQDDEARFIVKLAYKPNYSSSDETVFAYQSGSEIFVSGEGELQIFDVTGRIVSTETINGVKAVSVPAQGVYVFRLVGENVKTQKIVVR